MKRGKPNPIKLRKGVEPGKVLILLSGRFRGKRVVFLKQLASGMLLVSGPLKVNGVPLKRVNQVYTITTSTKVNIQGADVSKVDDNMFKKTKAAKKAGESQFFAEKQVRYQLFTSVSRRRKCLKTGRICRRQWTLL